MIDDNAPTPEPLMDAVTTGPTSAPRVAYGTFTARVRALVIDALIGAGALIMFVVLSDVAESVPGSGRVILLLIFGMIFYEPILVWRRGATVGHAVTGLRVVADSGGNPTFGQAFARYLIKIVLGIPSFITMALTRRRQAVHDLATRTTVRFVGDAGKPALDYYLEGDDVADVVAPSVLRRFLMIILYLIGTYVAFVIALEIVVPTHCLRTDNCSSTESVAIQVLGIMWLTVSIAVIALGVRARLPGARATSVIIDESPDELPPP
jgi:uncharacterized RDD family membrane protein YckC